MWPEREQWMLGDLQSAGCHQTSLLGEWKRKNANIISFDREMTDILLKLWALEVPMTYE